MKKIFWRIVLVIFCFGEMGPAYGGEVFKFLVQEKRYSDIVGLSLSKADQCEGRCSALHLLNASRASLLMGDYSGAEQFLRYAEILEPSNHSHVFIGYYLSLLKKDMVSVDSYAKELRQVSPERLGEFQVLKIIESSDSFSSKSIRGLNALAALHPKISLPLKQYTARSFKSPWVAGALSLIPGGGFIYLGAWQSAATSFLLNALSFSAAHNLWVRGMPQASMAAVALGSVFYTGGIFSSARSATDMNRSSTRREYDELVSIILPELKFVW